MNWMRKKVKEKSLPTTLDRENIENGQEELV